MKVWVANKGAEVLGVFVNKERAINAIKTDASKWLDSLSKSAFETDPLDENLLKKAKEAVWNGDRKSFYFREDLGSVEFYGIGFFDGYNESYLCWGAKVISIYNSCKISTFFGEGDNYTCVGTEWIVTQHDVLGLPDNEIDF